MVQYGLRYRVQYKVRYKLWDSVRYRVRYKLSVPCEDTMSRIKGLVLKG